MRQHISGTMAKGNYDHLPIPTYEEAISHRPEASGSRLGPEEISDDAERQGLLQSNNRNHGPSSNYEPPSVESERPSLDSLDGLDQASEDGVRLEMQQMEIEDPNDTHSNRSLLRYRFKRFTSFTSLNLPSFRQYLPSFSWPRINYQQLDSNRVVILGRLFGIFLIMAVLYVLIASDVLSFGRNRMNMGQMYDPESVRIFVQNHMNDHGNMQDYLQHITQFPHVAGTEGNYVLGEWVAELFKASELENVEMQRFDVYLNYPRNDGRRVAIVDPPNLAWEARIEENVEQTLVFHGHSKAGDVTGPLIYANFGSREDFKTLADNGVDVRGAIVLVRYYGSQGDRALKVKAAELAGAIGCIIYSDPAQDGFVKGPVFPLGRFMPEDGVQRGAVSLMSWVVGDVLSPGWASFPEERKRLSPDASPGLNQIPSIPISWNDALHLLEALKGYGQKMLNDWEGVPGVEYWSGNSSSPKVNLKNLQDEEVLQPIYNVVGRIHGWEQPEKRIIVGNHRDAWCTGGADPGSGTAIMLEVIRVFGELRRLGWKPLRTIEFASWDGEEYNLIGSTEHVEGRAEELIRNGWAYVNVDIAVRGTEFHAAASPIFERTLRRVIDRVTDPATGKPIRQVWEEKNLGIEGLGAGSDYVAFQDLVGTSSLDMSFKGDAFPYHSCYDNFEWMEKFGDPGFQYHKAMGEIWALLILELADKPNLPFDLLAYAKALSGYIDNLDQYAKSKAAAGSGLDLQPLQEAVQLLDEEARLFHNFDQAWSNAVYGSQGFESNGMAIQRMDHNNRKGNFESDLLDLAEGGGLVNRTQFKHVIFAPQIWSGYDEAFFPGVRDAIDANDWSEAQHQVQKVADILSNAAQKLTHN